MKYKNTQFEIAPVLLMQTKITFNKHTFKKKVCKPLCLRVLVATNSTIATKTRRI